MCFRRVQNSDSGEKNLKLLIFDVRDFSMFAIAFGDELIANIEEYLYYQSVGNYMNFK